MPEMSAFAPTTIRYIKLGSENRWAAPSLNGGELHFGYGEIPHELCLAGDWRAVARRVSATYSWALRDTARAAGEIKDFYTLGQDCLWIAFADEHLWWTFAALAVVWRGGDGKTHGARVRRAIGAWRNTDLEGNPLVLEALSTRLTKVSGYRGTICQVKERDYLLRRLRGEDEPMAVQAKAARAAMLTAAQDLIAALHWRDFETFVDLIFARTGRQRLSRVGGTRKDIDLMLRDPVTGEIAAVQVKSQANQAELDDYIERFEATGLYQRIFFICQSPTGPLCNRGRAHVHIWTRERLAELSLETGLFNWLTDKAA